MTALLLSIIVVGFVDTPESSRLTVPAVTSGKPAAGRRVSVTPAEFAGTNVRHTIYLPKTWQPIRDDKKRWPVVVEYTGNKFPASGSTGEVEDAALGYGIGRENAIWVVLPYISEDRQTNETTWWGDEQATADYAVINVPRICEQYGGHPQQVVICGFSRGAIGVNYIGLFNDQVAELWAGFVTHDHYDGVRHWRGTSWGSPHDAYLEAATARLKRINNRPVLICQNGTTDETRTFLEPRIPLGNITFLDVPMRRIFGEFPNNVTVHPHTDRWLLVPSKEREEVSRWFNSVIGGADHERSQRLPPIAR